MREIAKSRPPSIDFWIFHCLSQAHLFRKLFLNEKITLGSQWRIKAQSDFCGTQNSHLEIYTFRFGFFKIWKVSITESKYLFYLVTTTAKTPLPLFLYSSP